MAKEMYVICSSTFDVPTVDNGKPLYELSAWANVDRFENDCKEEESFTTRDEAKKALLANYKNRIEPVYKNGKLIYNVRAYWVQDKTYVDNDDIFESDYYWDDDNDVWGYGKFDLPTHYEIQDLDSHDVLFEPALASTAFWEYSKMCKLPENSGKYLAIFANGTKLLG
jgi:hypothetical protein